MSRIRELENFSKLANNELLRIGEKFLHGKNLLLILINSLPRGKFSNSLILDIKTTSETWIIYYFRIHFQHSMAAQEAVELRFLRTVIYQAENKLFVLHYSRLRRALFWGLMPLFEPADCFYFYFSFYQELRGQDGGRGCCSCPTRRTRSGSPRGSRIRWRSSRHHDARDRSPR